jgi:hypothetical protein
VNYKVSVLFEDTFSSRRAYCELKSVCFMKIIFFSSQVAYCGLRRSGTNHFGLEFGIVLEIQIQYGKHFFHPGRPNVN